MTIPPESRRARRITALEIPAIVQHSEHAAILRTNGRGVVTIAPGPALGLPGLARLPFAQPTAEPDADPERTTTLLTGA